MCVFVFLYTTLLGMYTRSLVGILICLGVCTRVEVGNILMTSECVGYHKLLNEWLWVTAQKAIDHLRKENNCKKLTSGSRFVIPGRSSGDGQFFKKNLTYLVYVCMGRRVEIRAYITPDLPTLRRTVTMVIERRKRFLRLVSCRVVLCYVISRHGHFVGIFTRRLSAFDDEHKSNPAPCDTSCSCIGNNQQETCMKLSCSPGSMGHSTILVKAPYMHEVELLTG